MATRKQAKDPKQIAQQAELPDPPEAEEVDGEQVVGTNNEERLAMMSRINDQLDTDRADELAHVNDDDTTEPFTIDGVATQQHEEEETPPPAATTTEEQQQLPLKFKIKVNGRDVELTQEELIARAQKVESADAYLQEAARLRKEVQDAPPPPTAVVKPQPSVQDAEDEERALVRAIQMGTEEEAMAAIRKLKSTTGPSVTADDITRTVDERLTFKEAVNRFSTEYKDLMDDPMLRKMALQRDQELLAAGDRRGYWERYAEVGNELRTWRDGIVKAAAPAAPANPQADKQQRKAAAPSVPVVTAKKAPSTVVEDEKEESVSEVIAAIAKARGGPQWARS